jgi:DNA-binding NarL/FixJ family response regulator
MVSPDVEKWKPFAAELGNRCQVEVIATCTGAQALDAVREKGPVAMVVDQDLGDMPGVELVPRVLQFNAMIHLALVSEQPEELFHEQTEGLGILMKLPSLPDRQTAVQFSERLMGVL